MMQVRRSGLVLLALTFVGSALGDEGWLYYGGDQGGKHYSSASHIDKNNVDKLDVAWVHRSGDVESFGPDMENTSTQ